MGMRSRAAFVAGLSLFWPFLQGPYFSMFFGAGSASAPSALPFAFNGLVFVVSLLIGMVGLGRLSWRRGALPLVGCALLSTVLLGLGAAGVGGDALLWAGAPVTALSFGALSCGWASLAGCRCAADGKSAVFCEVALSYACCYGLVFAVDALPGAYRAVVWALCPLLSAVLWARDRVLVKECLPCDVQEERGEEAFVSTRSRYLLPGAVASVALVSAVLAGLYSDVPAQSYGSSALCALGLVGCAVAARRRPAWGIAVWGLALVPVLMSGFCVMTFDRHLTVVGIDALTLGRRLLWVLYWWLLASGPKGVSVRAVAVGFAPAYAATRLIIDGLRVGAPGLAADPAFASVVTMAVALVLEVASLVVVGLVVAAQVRAASRPPVDPGSGAEETDDPRAVACGSLAIEFGLTERERDVLGLVSMGYTVQRIAEERGVSQNTVRTHTKGLYRKLDIHTKQEAIELVNARMG